MKPIKRIIIDIVTHKNQRYNTTGDYYRYDDKTMHICVSDLKDNRYELLVAIHELIEMILTEHYGIPEEEITRFDIAFEKNRKEGDLSEPGDDENSPYKNPHGIASAVERMMCTLMYCDWKKYEKACNAVS